MDVVDNDTQNQLKNAGHSIQNSLKRINKEYPEIKYLLVIEGQASKDNYPQNYELSYKRALALNLFWAKNSIDFGSNCEVLISGSGTAGTMRENKEYLNQRFLIHIVPKPGILETNNNLLSETKIKIISYCNTGLFILFIL